MVLLASLACNFS